LVGTDAWLAIVNPASGGARAARRWPQVEQALARAGVSFETARTSARGEGRAIAEDAVRAGRRRLLAVGGDGSVHDVLNGIMAVERAPDDLVTLAPIPVGTGNDWARSLAMPRNAAALAAVIAAEDTLLHDVGQLDFAQAAPGDASRGWFINIAGAGFDSHVIERLPANVTSQFAYLRGALAEVARYRAPRFRITTETGSLDERLLLAFVANGQYCGNRMHIAPHARPDDGQFDVVAIRDVALPAVLRKLPKLYRGTLMGDPLVWASRGARIRIETDADSAVQADGQVVGRTPVEIRVLPRALRVVRNVSGRR
jgi:YegS/Rv2252/BmrU family lipid kinase